MNFVANGLAAMLITSLSTSMGQDPVDVSSQPTPAAPAAAVPTIQPLYRSSTDTASWLDRLCAAAPERVQRLDHVGLRDARLVGVQIAVPGPVPPARRPTLLLIGALDGRSLAGSEAVLAIARDLTEDPRSLGRELTVVAIPCASPDALDRYLANSGGDGGNQRSTDDDGDDKYDEDGPEDVDGDGLVLQMLVPDPAGPWTRCDDERFLVPAGPDDASRYFLWSEGLDSDGDGRFNEDGPGGVFLDVNFPLDREHTTRAPKNGPLPLSESASLALAEFALERRLFAVLFFQGNHGGVAMPGGTPRADVWARSDRVLYERCAREYAGASHRNLDGPLPLREARGSLCAGSALDWFGGVVGALSLEIAPWGPTIAEPDVDSARDAVIRKPQSASGHTLSARDASWRRWLDNAHGGSAFKPWAPYEMADFGTVLIGGWRPWTIENPPPEDLPRGLVGATEFVRSLAAGQPRLELTSDATRRGELVTVKARVRNRGSLPTALAATAAVRTEPGAWIGISFADGARLLVGETRYPLPRLVGGDASTEVEWLVHAPVGAKIQLAAGAPWCVDAVRELTP